MTGSKLDLATRRALGAFYTPGALARAIVDRALELLVNPPRSILDPACGDGAFLEAGIAALATGSAAIPVTGVDIHPAALAAARKRLGPGVELVEGDALAPGTLGDRRFDLIVGNPPFGLRRDDARAWGLDASRTDSYAAFLAMGLSRLAPGGILAFITADTWLSIRSHRALRDLLLPHLAEVALLPPGAFDATVNTCAVFLAKDPAEAPIRASECAKLARVAPASVPRVTPASVPRVAPVSVPRVAPASVPASQVAYLVERQTVRDLPGHTIFVGDPGLAEIAVSGATRAEHIGAGHLAEVRTIGRNGQMVRIVRLGDIAVSPHGISTGANDRYIRVLEGTRGRYKLLEPGMATPPEVLGAVTDREREQGLEADWATGVGCFVPFDKGGAAAADDGWLPNYHVPTPYFVNWAAGAIADMRRNKGFAWKNWRYFFRPGLTFSVSGIYAPTFRLNAGGVFEAKSSGLFCEVLPPELLLGILCSRTARYLFKVFIKHSVDTSGADVARFPLVLPATADGNRIVVLVAAIVRKQKCDPRYPYHRHEQLELDALVARCYGLSDRELDEIDGWFGRRYPRLAAAQGPTTR